MSEITIISNLQCFIIITFIYQLQAWMWPRRLFTYVDYGPFVEETKNCRPWQSYKKQWLCPFCFHSFDRTIATPWVRWFANCLCVCVFIYVFIFFSHVFQLASSFVSRNIPRIYGFLLAACCVVSWAWVLSLTWLFHVYAFLWCYLDFLLSFSGPPNARVSSLGFVRRSHLIIFRVW